MKSDAAFTTYCGSTSVAMTDAQNEAQGDKKMSMTQPVATQANGGANGGANDGTASHTGTVVRSFNHLRDSVNALEAAVEDLFSPRPCDNEIKEECTIFVDEDPKFECVLADVISLLNECSIRIASVRNDIYLVFNRCGIGDVSCVKNSGSLDEKQPMKDLWFKDAIDGFGKMSSSIEDLEGAIDELRGRNAKGEPTSYATSMNCFSDVWTCLPKLANDYASRLFLASETIRRIVYAPDEQRDIDSKAAKEG